MGRKNKETTFGMIKPEAINRGIADDIFRRIRESGLVVEEEKKGVMTPYQFELLYGHTKSKVPKIYGPLKEYLTANDSIFLKVSGDKAVGRLLRLRGSSNPSESPAGTIRGDYAKDQDYTKLYAEGKPSLNVFHASDSKKEAKRDIDAFFGEGK